MKFYDSIELEPEEWTLKQPMFFSASAPLHGKHISVSPKGLPSSSFSILNPNLCAYVDATGSGIETMANVFENGRVTIMFCSFEASPRILRIYCIGRTLEFDEISFDGWLTRMGNMKVPAAHATILLDVFRVQTSCGFSVPRLALKEDPLDRSKQLAYLEDRQALGHWTDKQVSAGTITTYRAKNNQRSLDGLPGLKAARRDNGERIWYGNLRHRMQQRSGPIYTIVIAFTTFSLTIFSLHFLGMLREPGKFPANYMVNLLAKMPVCLS